MKKIFFLMSILFSLTSYAKEYHASINKGNDNNDGIINPVKTISAAVLKALPGDTITVHKGTYREWVNPVRGGNSDKERIVYRSAPGEKVEIKGSEIIKNWKKEKNGIWKITIPNSFFGDYNPYVDIIQGDWFDGKGRIHHTGEVFMNGKSFYETDSLSKINIPIINKADPKGSTYLWYCENSEKDITIWANFGKYNPNKELVEITVRPTCFYPKKPGINYITISGFYFSQAATQWGAPTAEQVGMIATHWNKGWIIENNVISDSKCSGITLGKAKNTGHNLWSNNPEKDGSLHYIEATFNVLRDGWNKDNIGSHIVRNNQIYNCEQTGICGSMGAAFSLIKNNYIHNIWIKRQFTGAEIAGIKFHAAIDAIIERNRIKNCGRGIWLDWMTQGTYISKNILYENDMEDFFTEVNHGPYIVDNNIMLSNMNVVNQSEGGAFVHNLFTGKFHTWGEPNRYTPYHTPHSTDIAGLSVIIGGDDRYYNNIFIGEKINGQLNQRYGLAVYDKAKDKLHTGGNIFFEASPYKNEIDFILESNYKPNVSIEEEGDNVYLLIQFKDIELLSKYSYKITTSLLGKTKLSNAIFENTDGSVLNIKDYFNNPRNEKINAGPFEKISTKIKIWKNL